MITVEDISKEVLTAVTNFDFNEPIVKVGVFGSVSRNEQLKNSDVDLVIDYVYPKDKDDDLLEKYVINYCDFCESIRKRFRKNHKKKVDIVEYQALDYPDNKILKREVERDVIWVYGK